MSAISVQGYMMKRKGAEAPAAGTAGGKSSRNIFKRSMSLKWVTRYFILYDDGRLVYHKERPAHLSGSTNGNNNVDSVGGGTLFATSVQQCDIERVNPDDLFGKDVNKLNVANSFHITVPRTQTDAAIGQTLLVTNGPSEYKSWILAFRKASANVLVTDKDAALAKERAAETKAREEQEAAVKRAMEQAEKERLEAERLENEAKRAEEERIAAEAAAAEAAVQAELKQVDDEKRAEADRLAELQRVADEEEAKLKAEAMQLKKEAEEEEAKLAREMKEAEEAYQESLSKDENGGEEVEVEVIEEGAVAAAAVGQESAPKDNDGKQESAEAGGETVIEVEGGTPKPQDSTEPQGGNTDENKLDNDETNEAGRRQFWIGIEWKGENCSSVKAMRQMKECLDPMSKMIGDRSFTLSNVAASEMTPDMFVERGTRSMNVKDFKVTVATMRTAHVEEQKAIKEYWAKLKEEKKAKERQANATVLAQEEAKKNTEKEKKRLQQVKVDMKRKDGCC